MNELTSIKKIADEKIANLKIGIEKIPDRETALAYSALRTDLADLIKKIDAHRLDATRELRAEVDRINDEYNAVKNTVSSVEDEIRRLLIEYEHEQRRIAAETQKKLDAQREQALLDGKSAPKIEVVKNEKLLKTRQVKILVCVDEKKTPREYMMPDEKKIETALRAGKTVPGWILKTIEQVIR